jgi:DNA polymerase III delta prime subunit
VRSVRLHEGLHVADYLKARNLHLKLRDFTAIIMAFSQRSNPMDALDLLTALEYNVAYETKAIHKYHFHFAKLIVQEFLEEALQTLDRAANAPAFGLQENGLAAMDVVIHSSNKGGQLSLSIPALGAELQRGLMKGDTVLLSRTGEAARQTQGFDGGDVMGDMPKGPRGEIEMPTGPRGDGPAATPGQRGGQRGGGWRADYEFEAEISSVMPQVSVKLIGCNAQQAASVRGGGWRIDKLANRTSFLRQLNALQDMMEVRQGTSQKAGVDPAIRDILVAGWDGNKADHAAIPDMCSAEKNEQLHAVQRQRMIDQAMDLQAMSHMNKSQTDALEAALFQRVTLIQGPPGTGKTHTAVALVQMWLRSRTSPILCTSDSNIAVDNLVDGLSRAGVRVARIGRPEAVRQDLMQYMVESIAGIEPGCKWSKDQQYQAINGVLRRAEVICATCAGAGSDILERFSFQACLIDEATQATEPATVVPLTKGCAQVVLIGDQKQLPPTIISRDADAAGLGTSLFERMLKSGIRAFMLKVQYRMHPAIATFPSKAFYKGELLSGTPPSARRAPMGFDWPVPAVPLAFVDVPDGYERSDGSSQTNPVEAQKIVNIVKKLCGGHDVLPIDIGIVTPYAAQVRAIKRLLHGPNQKKRSRFDEQPAPDSMEALEISTVDGFQGREKEVIVFTCTRANGMGNVGFLADPRRVNVMLTRARRGLIIVGHIPTLRRENTVWGPWLSWAGENGLICGAAATDADAANRLANIGMSSVEEIGGRGAGEVMTMGALLAPNMAGWGADGTAMEDGPKLKVREIIPEAWDDSDGDKSDGEETTTETGSNTIKGSTNSLAGLADGAWNSDDDAE